MAETGPILTWLWGLANQWRSLQALVIRNMMTRYGRANVGFLWVVLEPMFLTVGVMLVWSLFRSPHERGVQLVALVMTGYMPLTLYRHIVGGCLHVYRRSVPLLYHRNITFIDVLVANCMLEFLGTSAALTIVYSVLALSGITSPIRDIGLAVAGWMTMAFLSFGLASLFAALSEISDTFERFIQPIQYLLLPISGIFYMVEWLPYKARQLIWWVPHSHCYEMFRAGFFGEHVTTHWTWWYPLLWALGLTAAGLGLIENARRNIHTG